MARRFVPAADEVWRLQNDAGPDCRWFRRVVRGREDPSRGSMQGMYVLTAGGRLLGSLNSLNADAVLRMLERSLQAWAGLRPSERKLDHATDLTPEHRWEQSYPEGGLVLERHARDVGADPTAEPRRPVNRDALWFTAEEARGWLPGELTVGAVAEVAPLVARRMARLCLVDNVRGQTLPFSPEEVEASLRTEITSVDDGVVQLRLSGSTRAQASGPWTGGDNYWKPGREWPRSIETSVLGTARYDAVAGRFVTFEMVAIGRRTGRTGFNGRSREDDQEPRGIGFLLRLAAPDWRVAPTFINVYQASWIVQPG